MAPKPKELIPPNIEWVYVGVLHPDSSACKLGGTYFKMTVAPQSTGDTPILCCNTCGEELTVMTYDTEDASPPA